MKRRKETKETKERKVKKEKKEPETQSDDNKPRSGTREHPRTFVQDQEPEAREAQSAFNVQQPTAQLLLPITSASTLTRTQRVCLV